MTTVEAGILEKRKYIYYLDKICPFLHKFFFQLRFIVDLSFAALQFYKSDDTSHFPHSWRLWGSSILLSFRDIQSRNNPLWLLLNATWLSEFTHDLYMAFRSNLCCNSTLQQHHCKLLWKISACISQKNLWSCREIGCGRVVLHQWQKISSLNSRCSSQSKEDA